MLLVQFDEFTLTIPFVVIGKGISDIGRVFVMDSFIDRRRDSSRRIAETVRGRRTNDAVFFHEENIMKLRIDKNSVIQPFRAM